MTLRIPVLAATFALGLSVGAFAQSPLPWQSSSPSSPQSQPQQSAPSSQTEGQAQPHHHHHSQDGGGASSRHAAAPNAARKHDDRELDALATKYYAIGSKDPKAVERLKALEGKVAKFRKSLGDHGYDASDITSDAKKLEWRIRAQRKKLEAEAAPVAPAVPQEATTPAEVPAPATVMPTPAPAPVMPHTQPMIPAPAPR